MKRNLAAGMCSLLLVLPLAACDSNATLDRAVTSVNDANNATQVAVGMCSGTDNQVCTQLKVVQAKVADAQDAVTQAKKSADSGDNFPWWGTVIIYVLIFTFWMMI